jgi:hypothetical protein
MVKQLDKSVFTIIAWVMAARSASKSSHAWFFCSVLELFFKRSNVLGETLLNT